MLCTIAQKNSLKIIKTTLLYHGPLPFPTRPFILLFSPQNPLDHVSAFIRPTKLYFGNLNLHCLFAIFFLM